MCDLMKCKVCGQVKPPAREHQGESLCFDCEPTEAGFKVYSTWMDAMLGRLKTVMTLRNALSTGLIDRFITRLQEKRKARANSKS